MTIHSCWEDRVKNNGRAILGSLPFASFIWTAAIALIYFYAG
jgi:hypothetical protein